jgi:predicted  nucleic acid-binding Zn-ribbon protein
MEAGWLSHGVLAIVLLALLAALWRSGFLGRLMKLIEETMLGNWQLALLGAAAVALSLASGYTTFDGLRNFTSAPLLSVLVAFGIQGVLLIVSWLIGESFATGMSQQAARSNTMSAREAALGMGLGAVLTGVAFGWALRRYDAVGFVTGPGMIHSLRADWQRVTEVAVYFVTTLALVGLIVLVLGRGGDIVRPYVQSVRLIVKNAVLWVMLLACMSASVFFSFDSHFTAIFPGEQRQRAAEIRTLNQVAAVVSDIGERAQKVQAAEAGRLFETEGWRSYDAQLGTLALAARGAQAEIEAVLVAKLEERQRGIGELQERIATAERSQSALLRKRDELEAELLRLETSIGALEAELAKAQATCDETRQAIAAKEIEASAEDGGVEGSQKRGKGPVWRQRTAEVAELKRKLKIADEPRLVQAQRQRDAASARIVSLKREMATVVAEVAKYKGAISAAGHRIKAAREGETDGARIDPARVLEAFERARTAFRHQPEAVRLANLQTLCESLLGALSGVAAVKERVHGIDCDPKAAAEAAARVFALNAGLAAFGVGCAGGAKLPQAAGTDELLAFGRKCLQDSGLASKDSADLGARLQAIEMNRDDKAHRFVVTWNALLDGNRLGYLALALAIGIDSLVFMAGLFGAAAARSPLSDVPSPRPRSAEQLEAIVRNALGEHRLENAELVLAAMRPAPGDDDQRSEVDLTGYDAGRAERIRKVLVAGRSIGAVERVSAQPEAERYLVRPELLEFLSALASAARESQCERSNRSRLAQIVAAALEPDRPGNAQIVLRHAEPIKPRRGFVARVDLNAVAKDKDRRLVQNVVSAGMGVSAVARQGARSSFWGRAMGRRTQVETAYLLSAELFETLLQHRASAPATPGLRRDARAVRPPVVDALSEYASNETVASVAGQLLLTDARAADGPSHERDEDELRRRFRDALLKEVASEAQAVAADLGRRPDGWRDPRASLERMARDSHRALQRGARALAREHTSDERALELLGETCRELAANVQGLWLSLLEDLMGEADRSGDDDLLSRLRRLRDAIAAMDAE